MSAIKPVQQMTQGRIWKQILLFFFPILMGTFFQQMYNTVDTVIVGRFVGTQALAAVGSTGSLINMINGFFIGIGSGATVILSQFYGANDASGVYKSLHTGFTLALLLGAVITLLGCGFTPTILRWMNTPKNCIDLSSLYIRLFFTGSVFSMIYNMGSGILRAMGDSRRPMIFLIISCCTNIVMDIVFVIVLGMGVAGAAVATVLSQVISALLVTVSLLHMETYPLEVRGLQLDRTLLKRILAIGIPAGLQFVTFDLSNILIQSGINSFGAVTMAAWTAYGKTDSLTWMISGAFGVSITTFVGQNFGAQQYARIRRGVLECLAMSIALVSAMSLVEYAFREFILGIYTADLNVIRTGALLMTIIVPFNAFFMPVEIFAGTMRGTGYSLVPTIITCCCVCVFRIIWLFTVVQRLHQLKYLAMCYPISWILCASVFTIVYLKGGWLTKRIEHCGMEPEVRR